MQLEVLMPYVIYWTALIGFSVWLLRRESILSKRKKNVEGGVDEGQG